MFYIVVNAGCLYVFVVPLSISFSYSGAKCHFSSWSEAFWKISNFEN